MSCMVIGSALASNVRRIQRYLDARIKLENEQMKALIEQELSQDKSSNSFFVFLNTIFRDFAAPISRNQPEFNC